jgi:hypothetical protein
MNLCSLIGGYPIHFAKSQTQRITIAKATGPRQPHLTNR